MQAHCSGAVPHHREVWLFLLINFLFNFKRLHWRGFFMQKIGSITSTADANGEWTNGNVAAGTPPTILDAAWFNTVQRELANVVTAGGLSLDSSNDAQVLAALKLLIKGGVTGVVGEARNAKMSVTAASATATFTADELIVGTALGGLQYRIGSFSKTINLATTGAGGMDTGSAPVSGFVALYAIYNPSTNTSALLAVNATAAVVPEVYGGANMPAGYTASALVSVWQTNASSQFKIGSQYGRRVFFPATSVLSTTGSGSANPFTPFTISAAAPRNAKDVNLTATIGTNTSSAAVYSSVNIAADSGGAGSGTVTVSGASGGNIASSVTMIIPIITPQTLYQTLFASAGTTTYNVVVSFYTF